MYNRRNFLNPTSRSSATAETEASPVFTSEIQHDLWPVSYPQLSRSHRGTSEATSQRFRSPSVRKEYSKDQWNARLSETTVSKADLNNMIFNYLLVEGYPAAAAKFAREADLSQTDLEEWNVKGRRDVKNLILAGKIQEAIETVNDIDPELLDTNAELHFSLLRLQLIELIRASYSSKDGDIQPALDFASSHLAQRAPSDPKFLNDLEQTMALLCFPPESLVPQLRDLMDLRLRLNVAEDVNSSLLKRQHLDGEAKIKRLVKLWSWSSESLADHKVKVPALTKSELF